MQCDGGYCYGGSHQMALLHSFTSYFSQHVSSVQSFTICCIVASFCNVVSFAGNCCKWQESLCSPLISLARFNCWGRTDLWEPGTGVLAKVPERFACMPFATYSV